MHYKRGNKLKKDRKMHTNTLKRYFNNLCENVIMQHVFEIIFKALKVWLLRRVVDVTIKQLPNLFNIIILNGYHSIFT